MLTSLLADRSIAELGTLGIVDSVGHDLLDLLWQTLLESLWHNGVTSGVADLSSLLVAAGVVCSVWNLLLDGLRNLFLMLEWCCTTSSKCTYSFLDLLWKAAIGGVGCALAGCVGRRHSCCC